MPAHFHPKPRPASSSEVILGSPAAPENNCSLCSPGSEEGDEVVQLKHRDGLAAGCPLPTPHSISWALYFFFFSCSWPSWKCFGKGFALLGLQGFGAGPPPAGSQPQFGAGSPVHGGEGSGGAQLLLQGNCSVLVLPLCSRGLQPEQAASGSLRAWLRVAADPRLQLSGAGMRGGVPVAVGLWRSSTCEPGRARRRRLPGAPGICAPKWCWAGCTEGS